MQKKYLLIILLCPIFLISQNDLSDLFSALDKSEMTTDILFNHAFSFSKIADTDKDLFSTNDFFQGYNELATAANQHNFLTFEKLQEAKIESRITDIIPIGLVFSEFDIINDQALENGDVHITNGKLRKSATSENPIFEIRRKLFAAPFRESFDKASLKFVLDDRFFVNTSPSRITGINVDFNDGNGLRKVNINQVISVNYPSSGTKELVFNIVLESGEILTSRSLVHVKDSAISGSRHAQVFFTSSITPDLSAYGEPVSYPGEGEYEIFLDTTDGVLDKPIIVVDGFDPGDARSVAALYGSLSYTDTGGPQNLADNLRAEGFDVVILNFPVYTRAADMSEIDGGTDFIERNAMLLVDLITIINGSKTGSEQNVIIGPSMGGLITRYALNYMENQSLPHDTRLFLSFDSPHRGANVPIGLQHQINFLAFGLGGNNVVELQEVINGIAKSPAARQMLVDHLESHLLGSSIVDFDPSLLLPDPHPWKDIFDTNINALTVDGFPQTTRNVAIINGSGIGNPFPDKLGGDVNPGFNLLNDNFVIDVVTSTAADLEINYTPATASGSQLVSSVVISVFGFPVITSTANSQAFTFSDGVDAAPGGLYDMSLLGGSSPPTGLISDFFDALKADYFNFIPAVSAIALEITANGEIDWYHDIDIGTGTPPTAAPGDVINSTPFINWYMPDDNEEHVELTEANVIFALTEIIPEALDTSSPELETIRLEKNPVKDQIGFITNEPVVDTKLNIYDLSGRLVMNNSLGTLTGTTHIRINLSSGVYILKLESDQGFYTTKLVVD